MNKKLVAVNFTVEKPVELGSDMQMQPAFQPGRTYFGTALEEDGQITGLRAEVPQYLGMTDGVPAGVLESVKVVREIALIHS